MRRLTALPPLALAAGLLLPLPARAADEPVATAPIPPPAATAPQSKTPPQAQLAPRKPAPHASRREAEKKTAHAKRQRGKRSEQAIATTRKHPVIALGERKAPHGTQPQRRAEPPRTLASREPPPRQPAQRPRRSYREEYMVEPATPPFPPPWYDRGPPFAYMPYPRGPMPPWEF